MHQKAIIIPAYNEEKTIAGTILDFFEKDPTLYFVIVNNNSKDQTYKVAIETLSQNQVNGIVINEYRQGKGFAVRRAFQEIDAKIYVMIDADLTYKAVDLNSLLEPILNNMADMVVGNRHANGAYSQENKRPFHNFGNLLVKKLINLLFRSNLKDILSGYRVFNRKFVKNFPLMSGGFELETELALHSLDKRFRILELPITYLDRPEGSFSKLNTYKDGFKVLKSIFNIFRFYKPLVFFMTLSFCFTLFSIASGAPVIQEYVSTKYVAHLPLAILATGFGIISVMCFAIALILDSIVTINKQNYEIMLNNYSE